jgi:tetratricopeptide (TPR) repeat protein
MSAREKRGREHRGRGTRSPHPAHLAAWALIAVIVAGALLVRLVGDEPIVHVRRAAPDSLASLDPTDAYRQAIQLQRGRRSNESLPYFRRALAGRPNDWRLRVNYAAALNDAALEVQDRGVPMPVIRSSLERVALARQALAQLDEAERLAPGAVERAFVLAAAGQRLVTWGFPLEARERFARAVELDRSWGEVLAGLDARLADPTRPDSEAGSATSAEPGIPMNERVENPRSPH